MWQKKELQEIRGTRDGDEYNQKHLRSGQMLLKGERAFKRRVRKRKSSMEKKKNEQVSKGWT